MWRSGGLYPHIFNLGTRCDSVVSLTPRSMGPGDPQKWQNILPLQVVENPYPLLPPRSEVTKMTELLRLNNNNNNNNNNNDMDDSVGIVTRLRT